MQTLHLKNYGIVPGQDITEALNTLFASHPEDTLFVLEDGDYGLSGKISADYRLSNTEPMPERKLGLLLKGMKNVRVECSGSRLWCVGQMQPVTFDHCENVVFENAVIDWKKPLNAEGIVTGFGPGYIDLYVDPVKFPHRFTEEGFLFDVGNDEWYPMQSDCSAMQFNGSDHTVRRNTGDKFVPGIPEAMGGSVYRFSTDFSDTAVGNIFVLRHNLRVHAGIFMEKCENITLRNVTLHSTGGLGCLTQFCRDLTFERVNFLPNTAAGREVINGRDDGFHITNCSGTVTVRECEFMGLMDDPINIHSCCCPVDHAEGPNALAVRYGHFQSQGFLYWAEPGDEIVFIDRRSMQPVEKHVCASFTPREFGSFGITFEDDFSEKLSSLLAEPERIALDDLTHTADFVCERNRFGSCRARGILISTPGKVRVRDNLFDSSGTAILIAGDSNGWYESGAVRDVEITGNVFTDACLSSEYQFGGGIISISPAVPEPNAETPFHTHVKISNNRFDSPDTTVLYAFSCGDLEFSDNIVTKSPRAHRWHRVDELVRVEYCRDVRFSGNRKIGPFGLADFAEENCVNVEEIPF